MLCKLSINNSKHNLNMKCLKSIYWRSPSIQHVGQILIPDQIYRPKANSIIIYKGWLRSYTTCMAENRIVSDICKEWVLRFEEKGIPEPESSIKLITEYVLRRCSNQTKNNEVEKNTTVTKDQEDQIKTLCECRLARMPVQYIIREWDFRELRLVMSPPVFIPRPETERLVDLVLAVLNARDTVLEVGCGSGAICLSLLNALPQTRVVAVDQSSLACQLTVKNAQLNNLIDNLEVVQSKLGEDGSLSRALPLDRESVDVLVSNPPYVPAPQLMQLQPEIKLYEDLRALEAGRDGMRVIRGLLRFAPSVLRSKGQVFLEVDPSHPKLIEQWLSKQPELGLRLVNTFKDYCDRERFVQLEKI